MKRNRTLTQTQKHEIICALYTTLLKRIWEKEKVVRQSTTPTKIDFLEKKIMCCALVTSEIEWV